MARLICVVTGMKLRRTHREVWPQTSLFMQRLVGHVLEVGGLKNGAVTMRVIEGANFEAGHEIPIPRRFVNEAYFECVNDPPPAPPAAPSAGVMQSFIHGLARAASSPAAFPRHSSKSRKLP